MKSEMSTAGMFRFDDIVATVVSASGALLCAVAEIIHLTLLRIWG